MPIDPKLPFAVLPALLFAALTDPPARAQGVDPAAPAFVEVTDELRLDFDHLPGNEGRYLIPEISGSGGGFLDYDGDGDLDVYLVQGGELSRPRALDPVPNRLFRQDGGGSFVDVTARSGLGDTGYGMGLAAGDVDGDGALDVYVSNYGPDGLYRNNGDGSFTEVTAEAGIAGDGWSASAVFCDYEGDGALDLYVTRYVLFDPELECTAPSGAPEYCGPMQFTGESDVLYHNRGGGVFEDVSLPAGIASLSEPGFGVVCADLTGDGRPDFYVANDSKSNQLWINRGDGTFVDEAVVSGAAFGEGGQEEAGMGVACGDTDGDGDLDLLLTHLRRQTNTLYRNDGVEGFRDVSMQSGIGAASLRYTGFGTAFLDYDHDGDLDLAVANGRISAKPPLPRSQEAERATMPVPWLWYAEPNQLLENEGKGRFREAAAGAGVFGRLVEVSRGLAVGDLDRYVDQDLLVTNTASRARLFRNDVPKKGRWLRVRALLSPQQRDAYGAEVRMVAGGAEHLRLADPGFGYLTTHDPTAHFGVPASATAEQIAIRWPGGGRQILREPPLDRTLVVIRADAPAAGRPSARPADSPTRLPRRRR